VSILPDPVVGDLTGPVELHRRDDNCVERLVKSSDLARV
jgi:hypothetical protein